MPLISIVIPIYNHWAALERCLHSLANQTSPPEFEVIVVDDGSDDTAPSHIRNWQERLELTVVRQVHSGIASARNYGILASQASILLFADADSRLRPDCLSKLAATIVALPNRNYFQLRLVGDGPGIMGRAEALRLEALQTHLIQSNGGIRYLNTAGFAIRRSKVDVDRGLFDPMALRAEDTLLLAGLMQQGELPFFVHGAAVEHAVLLSFLQTLRKDIDSVRLEDRSYRRISAMRIKIRMSNRDRLNLLRSMWKISKRPAIGRRAWWALTTRQLFQRLTFFIYSLLPARSTM